MKEFCWCIPDDDEMTFHDDDNDINIINIKSKHW